MIGKVSGLLDHRGADHVLIDTGGVGYIVHCSERTLAAMPAPGEAVALYTDLLVREDLMQLYGFRTLAEREWHRLLMTVQGVGARVALSILSVLTVSELSSAIALQDKSAIGRANGVGPKLAVRVVTELKGKVPATGVLDPGVLGLQAALGDGVASGNVADAVSALTNLGYSSAQASAAVARVVGREGDGIATDKLIRLGLKELSS